VNSRFGHHRHRRRSAAPIVLSLFGMAVGVSLVVGRVHVAAFFVAEVPGVAEWAASL
jgi:hypothetical protein